jgi:hypothetical protein
MPKPIAIPSIGCWLPRAPRLFVPIALVAPHSAPAAEDQLGWVLSLCGRGESNEQQQAKRGEQGAPRLNDRHAGGGGRPCHFKNRAWVRVRLEVLPQAGLQVGQRQMQRSRSAAGKDIWH